MGWGEMLMGPELRGLVWYLAFCVAIMILVIAIFEVV